MGPETCQHPSPSRIGDHRSRAAQDAAVRHAAGPNGAERLPILVLAPQPFYEDRGTPIALRQVLEALTDLGYRVDVVTYAVGRSLEIPGVRVFRTANPFRFRRVPIGLSMRKLVLDACLIPVAWRRLRAERYQALHAVEESAFLAVALGRRYRIPIVYDMQSSLPEQLAKHTLLRSRPAQRLLRALEKWLLRRVDFVAASAGLAGRVTALAPATPLREWRFAGRGTPVSKADTAELRETLAIPCGSPVVLYSGTFASYQGLPNLLAAMPSVVEAVPDVVFVLVGAEDGDSMIRLPKDPIEARYVRIVKRQSRDRIPTFLAMADVLVSPRCYGDNLPLKIFDYLAAGKPIVATDVPAHRVLLDPSRADLVDPSGLGAAITRLLKSPARAQRLSESARTYAESRLGWMRFVTAIADLYEEVRAGAAQRARGAGATSLPECEPSSGGRATGCRHGEAAPLSAANGGKAVPGAV